MNAMSRNLAESLKVCDDLNRILPNKDEVRFGGVTHSITESHSSARAGARELLASFDMLPDDALVRLDSVCQLFSCSRATVWRWAKNGQLPAPYRFGVRFTAWRVGDLRRVLHSASKSTGLQLKDNRP